MSFQEKQNLEYILAEYMGKLFQTTFILKFDVGRQVYIKNGEIIKIDKYTDVTSQQQYSKHLQQIQHLKWIKNTSVNLENEIWSVIWNGYKLLSGGTSKINGEKVGKWIELFEHFWEKSKIFHIGNYQDGRKTGKWISQFQDTSIGGGFYTESGQKDGRWIEVYNYFRDYYQITYDGIYDNGTKLGIWSMKCNNNIIGGGLYDINGLKIGKWIELYEQLLENHEIFIEGEYYNGIKIGLFKIILQNNIIGGGEYNQNGLKIGNWIELDQCFNMQENIKNGIWKLHYLNKIIGGGFFDQNGRKNGYWIEISQNFYCDCQVTFREVNGMHSQIINSCSYYIPNINSGGGRYQENQKKLGKWIELHENYWDEAQILFTGDYHMGSKKGIWMTIVQNKIIGGGCYTNNGMKNGKWIDLYHNFWEFCQVTFQGSYIYGIKTGIWGTYFENDLIGGGEYNENGLKQGQWIELHENFDNIYSSNTQIKIQGNYQNNRKSGSWEYINRSKIIGGGLYDENGFKHGKWIELDDDFNLSLVDPCKITYYGEYDRGQKKGKFVQLEIY